MNAIVSAISRSGGAAIGAGVVLVGAAAGYMMGYGIQPKKEQSVKTEESKQKEQPEKKQ